MSCFEDLPNELFNYMFQYFDLAELNESFYELNLRFQILVDSCSVTHVYIQSKLSSQFISHFATKIQSLHIENCRQHISLIPFASSLKKLVFGRSINYSCNELSMLENLRYLDCGHENICNYISQQTKLQHLSVSYVYLSDKSSQFSFLKSLSLYDTDGTFVFDNIISQLCHLTHLQLHDYYNKVHPSVTFNQIQTYSTITNFHLYLRNGFHQTQIDWYLIHLPNIKQFHIEYLPCIVYYSWHGPYELLNLVANSIEKYFHNLRQFSCLATFEIRFNLPFDMIKIHSIYQQYHVETNRNDNRSFEFYSKKKFL